MRSLVRLDVGAHSCARPYTFLPDEFPCVVLRILAMVAA